MTIVASTTGTAGGRYLATVQVSQHAFEGRATGARAVAATATAAEAVQASRTAPTIFMIFSLRLQGANQTMSAAPEAVKPRSRLSPAGVIALVLALLTLVAAARDPAGLSRFVLGFAYRGVILDVDRWREWCEANRNFFGPLRPGARFAFVEDIKDSTGVVFTRTRDGTEVRKSHFLRFSDVPVVLAAEPPIAAEIQALRMDRDGDRFWDGLKNLARRRVLHSYRFCSREEMERLGFAAWLRAIDIYDPADDPPRHP